MALGLGEELAKVGVVASIKGVLDDVLSLLPFMSRLCSRRKGIHCSNSHCSDWKNHNKSICFQLFGSAGRILSITVMTLNLHEGEQRSESPNSWERRRDICVSVITSYSPIIFCTQQGEEEG
ncbi:hypothetical protein ABZP36_028807 [Zizania latifolia]